MRIALWDIDPFTETRKRLSDAGWDVVLTSPARCGEELLNGRVDAALVPCIEVLKNTAAFSVLPGVGLASTRGFPHAALRVNRPVNEIRTVRCDEDAAPFYGVASVLLREQYERVVSRVDDSEADAELLFGDAAVGVADERRIDLGVEWFEMTGTPLAWGFFVTRPGTTPDAATTTLQNVLSSFLRGEDDGSPSDESDPDSYDARSLRVMYDPEVSAGVDELAHYLFYVGILDDIPALRLMAASE